MFSKVSLIFLVAILTTSQLKAQPDEARLARPTPPQPAQTQYTPVQNRATGVVTYERRPIGNQQKARQRVQLATQKLKNSDSSNRDEAKEELRKALSAEYDEVLAQYDKNLDRLAKQLQAMQEKLEKRKSAKDDMIKLRMQVLEAEADDLGWPGQTGRTGFSGPFGSNSGFNQFPNANSYPRNFSFDAPVRQSEFGRPNSDPFGSTFDQGANRAERSK